MKTMFVGIKKHDWPIYFILTIGSIIMVFPFFWSLLSSSKTMTECLLVPPKFWPSKLSIESYVNVLAKFPFNRFFLNTGCMILIRVVVTLIISSMAAYAFARINFVVKDLLFIVCLLPMMVPSQIFTYPQYMIAIKLKLTNTVWGLALPGLASTFGIFMMRQYFMTIPDELEEAAILDGCNYGQIYLLIMLPLVKTGLVSLGIFTALFAYKDLLWPLVCNTKLERMTLSSGLAFLQGQYSTNYPQLMAGSIIAMAPMVIIFIVFQKQFVAGVASSGIKG